MTRADNNRTALGRLALGAAVLAAAALPARRPAPPRLELDCFEAVNALPDSLYPEVWPLMQFGALAAVPATAAAVWGWGDPGRARRLLVAGTATWALAKGVKRLVRRGRPVAVGPVRVRGQAQSGDGFVSGHAAVAVALAAGAMRSRPGLDPALAVLAAVVGISRMYVGAHLPLDVLGGAALGFVVDAAIELTWPQGAS